MIRRMARKAVRSSSEEAKSNFKQWSTETIGINKDYDFVFFNSTGNKRSLNIYLVDLTHSFVDD